MGVVMLGEHGRRSAQGVAREARWERSETAAVEARPRLQVVTPRPALRLIPGGQVEQLDGAAAAGELGQGTRRRSRAGVPLARRRSRGLRLTARGRVAAQFVLVLVAVLLGIGVAASTRASSTEVNHVGERSFVVRSGDTLWDIAARYMPDRDRYSAMAEIRRMNDLRGSRIEVGQELVLPGS